MAVDTNLGSLFEKLKLEDPYLAPTIWESIPSESGGISSSYTNPSSSSHVQYSASAVSESSLVRLALGALQGVESALISIQKLSALFCFDSADRSFHHIPNLWTRSSSIVALGNLLKSIGHFGCIIFLLHKFVHHFTCLSLDGSEDEVQKCDAGDGLGYQMSNHTLVNQAFAVSVAKVLDGYTSSLNTLYASVNLRRRVKTKGGGCFTTAGHGEITLLEAYLHSAGLRTQMDVLGNICNMSDLALRYSEISLQEISAKAFLEFNNFHRSGALLAFLYTQLKVANPAHCSLLKFLFLRSWEPYCGFIRSWIFEGSITDPFNEFIVETVKEQSDHERGNTGVSNDFPLASVRVREGVLPSFLEECLLPLFRAGQQLQIIMKLLEFCNAFGPFNGIHEEFLPGIRGFSNEFPSFKSSLLFEKGAIETMVVSRNSFYQKMLEKIDNVFTKSEFRFREISLQGMQHRYANHARNLNSPVVFSTSDSLETCSIDTGDQTLPHNTVEAEVSTDNDFSCTEDLLESSECSWEDNSEGQSDFDLSINAAGNDVELEPDYLSALSFTADELLLKQKFPQDETSRSAEYVSYETCKRTEISCFSAVVSNSERAACDSSLPYRSEEKSISQTIDNQIANSGQSTSWLPDCFPGNLLNNHGRSSKTTWLHAVEIELEISSCRFGVQLHDNVDSGGSVLPRNPSLPEAYEKDQHPNRARTFSSSTSLPSWQLKHHSDFFSMNPILTRNSLNPKRESEQLCSRDSREPYPFFDFTSVKDPCEVYMEKSATSSRDQLGAGNSVLTSTAATSSIRTSRPNNLKDCFNRNLENTAEPSHTCSPVNSKVHYERVSSLENAVGGSGWERLLANSSNISSTTVRHQKTSLVTVLEMPLDHIIKKCLLEEIVLQYKYLSKLTIKLLEEGFSLQNHLLALRRYHFMELADWAHLFVTSLQHHKWYTIEAEKRISEIQGILELSVQRSSCEGDPYKDRLAGLPTRLATQHHIVSWSIENILGHLEFSDASQACCLLFK
ncbi:putative indole-3-acetaldehyde oxidase-like [Capsicum annuum]|nr:putative indole-3-acetaldehyde oxidase-like [Capsicum annuum]